MATDTKYHENGFAIGDIVKFNGSGKFYQITEKDVFFLVETETATGRTSLAAGGSTSFVAISKLDPPDDQIYHINKIRLYHNLKLFLRQPAGVSRWGLDKSPDNYITDKDRSTDLDIFILRNKNPSAKFENTTNVTITPKVQYVGWKYRKVEITGTIPSKYTIIQGSGFE